MRLGQFCLIMMDQSWNLLMFWACGQEIQEAKDEANIYTKNHIEYNRSFFWLMMRIDWFFLALVVFKKRPQWNACVIKQLCQIIFVILRFATLALFVGNILPSFFDLIGSTWSLTSKNWWVSEEEDFYQNCSLFNAIVCWFIWLFFSLVIYFSLFVSFVIILATISFLK